MKNVKFHGVLTASDTKSRVLRYLLLPFGEAGNTSIGKVTASAKTIRTPTNLDELQFNMEHDGTRPVGKFVELKETAKGLECAVRVLETTAGDDLLVEASEGVRTGASVELANVELDASRRLVAADLIGAAACTRPAFNSARLTGTEADEEVSDEEVGDAVEDAVLDTLTEIIDQVIENLDKDPEEIPEEEEENTMAIATKAAKARTGFVPGAPNPLAKTTPRPVKPFPELLAHALASGSMAAASKLEEDMKAGYFAFSAPRPAGVLTAAGEPAPPPLTNVPLPQNDHQAQWVGETWLALPIYGRIWRLFETLTLEDMWVQGFDAPITNELRLADYDGAPNQIPTGSAPTYTPWSAQATRHAVGINFDRAIIDFGKSQLIADYIQTGFRTWDDIMDKKTAALIASSKTALVAKAPREGVDPVVTELVSGMMRLNRIGATPSVAILGENKFYSAMTEKEHDRLQNVALDMGIDEGRMQSLRIIDGSGLVPDDAVIMADSRAIRTWTLAGGPVRVSALALMTGQTAEALHGYEYQRVQDKTALLDVKPNT